MPKQRLTQDLLRSLQGPTEARDDLAPGLVARFTSKGVVSLGVRWKAQGRDHRQHLGRWPDEIDLKEARRQARKLTAAPRVRPRRPPTVAEAADLWLSAQWTQVDRGAKRGSSVDANERHLRLAILPGLGHERLHELTRAKVHGWLDTLAGGPGVNRQLATLKAMLNWCLDRDLIESNPAARIKPPVAEIPRDRILTEAEIRAFWNASMPERAHRALKLCLVVGCRLGEAAGLAHSDISDGVWHLGAQSTKGNRPRKIPLSALALELVGSGEGRVFGIRARSISQAWDRHRDRVDLGDVTAHDLRRTCSSMLVSRLGYPESTASAVLGHAPQTVTGKHYVIVSETTAREALIQWASLLEVILRDG